MTLTIISILLLILWLNVSYYVVRDMNNVDGDAFDWVTHPLWLKGIIIIFAPIILLIYDRHIWLTKKK